MAREWRVFCSVAARLAQSIDLELVGGRRDGEGDAPAEGAEKRWWEGERKRATYSSHSAEVPRADEGRGPGSRQRSELVRWGVDTGLSQRDSRSGCGLHAAQLSLLLAFFYIQTWTR